jgi:hypothetical protein
MRQAICNLIASKGADNSAVQYLLATKQRRDALEALKLHSICHHSTVDIPDHWEYSHGSNATRINALLERAREENIHGLLLENAAIVAEGECPGCFAFGDVDVWVPTISQPLAIRLRPLINLQDLPLTGALRYARRWPTFSEMEKRSRFGLMAPEELLLQLCIHAFAHWLVASPGILLYRDIAWHTPRVDWGRFDEIVESTRSKSIAHYPLRIAHGLFGISVPRKYRYGSDFEMDRIFSPDPPTAIWKLRVAIMSNYVIDPSDT